MDWRADDHSWGAARGSEEDDDRPTFESFLTKKATLSDHLLWQLRLNPFSEEERIIGTLVIGNLNEDGLLQVSPEEIASQNGFDLDTVQKAIQKIQAFDPPGVAARDLRECLLIQAQQIYPQEQLLQKIICDHLGQLAKKNYQAVARELGVPLEEVIRATRLIGELDPRPGRRFSDENIPYITPDVYVFKVGDDYVVMLNEDGLPKLRINSYYRNILREQAQFFRGGQRIYQREDPLGPLADQVDSSAPADDLPGDQIHREIPTGVPGPGSGLSKTHGPQGCGHGCGDARVHHQPGDLE